MLIRSGASVLNLDVSRFSLAALSVENILAQLSLPAKTRLAAASRQDARPDLKLSRLYPQLYQCTNIATLARGKVREALVQQPVSFVNKQGIKGSPRAGKILHILVAGSVVAGNNRRSHPGHLGDQ